MKCDVLEYVDALKEIDMLDEYDSDDMAISVYSVALQLGWYADMYRDEDGALVAMIG